MINFQIYIANGFADILRHLRMSESKTCDLSNFPAEVSLKVLKYLDATGVVSFSVTVIDLQIFHWQAAFGPNSVPIDQFGRISAVERGKCLIRFTKTSLKI